MASLSSLPSLDEIERQIIGLSENQKSRLSKLSHLEKLEIQEIREENKRMLEADLSELKTRYKKQKNDIKIAHKTAIKHWETAKKAVIALEVSRKSMEI